MQPRQTFEFQPFSTKQKKVLTWWCPDSPVKNADGIIADGAIRSGKTLSMSLSYVMWAMANFDQQNFIMAGKTVGSFRRNVLFLLKQMLTSRGYGVQERRADNLMIVSNGAIVNYFYLFGGKDERSQDLIQGITAAGAMFDEVALMPQSFVNQATARCSVTGAKLYFNCNPDSPRHWFKVEWLDRNRNRLSAEEISEMETEGKRPLNFAYLHFTMDDNLSLDEETKQKYRSRYTGVFYNRYILGEWCIADGLVYPMFSEEKHVKQEHQKGPLKWIVSIDYGTVNPFAAGLWSFNGKHAQLEYEYYYSGRDTGTRRTDEEHYTELEKLIGDKKVESIIVDPSAASFIECIKKHGKYVVASAKNDVLDGIRVVTTMLAQEIITVHAGCSNTVCEFGLYSWDMDSIEDCVIKESDHAMDAMRYFVYTYLRRMMRWEY